MLILLTAFAIGVPIRGLLRFFSYDYDILLKNLSLGIAGIIFVFLLYKIVGIPVFYAIKNQRT